MVCTESHGGEVHVDGYGDDVEIHLHVGGFKNAWHGRGFG